jgi:hypothetical protein
MNKLFKILFFIGLSVLIGYFVYIFSTIFKNGHSIDWETYKQYMWIFKDSAKKDVETFGVSCVQKNDIYNNFRYKVDYNVILWEFKETEGIDLKSIAINQNISLENIKFESGEILNKGDILEIPIKYDFSFNQIKYLNIDRYSKIKKEIEGVNYKGFYGNVNKMSLSDGNYNHQIIFNYKDGITPTLFLFYKKTQFIYVIIVFLKNRQTFNDSIINILDLK